jgi:hypothetical protein
MNAPLSALETRALGDIEDFTECCEVHAWYCAEGWISLQTAVDNLQALAERWALVTELGQDAVQKIIATPFARFRTIVAAEIEAEERGLIEPEPDDSHGVDEIIRRLELADPRDSWKYTGETLPPENIRNSDISGKSASTPRPYGTPQSTIEAFKHVVGLGDPERLSTWLLDHSDVAPALLKEVG